MEEIVRNERLLVRSWASDVDEQTLVQATRHGVLRRPRRPGGAHARRPSRAGATVGSVIPTDSAIIPAAVGVDIGCGMVAVETSLSAEDLPDDLGGILSGVSRAVPAGFSRNKEPTTPAWRWIEQNPLPRGRELPVALHKKAAAQLGTLGSGNHFVEICKDERDLVWAVLHSGSRGVGNELARAHRRRQAALPGAAPCGRRQGPRLLPRHRSRVRALRRGHAVGPAVRVPQPRADDGRGAGRAAARRSVGRSSSASASTATTTTPSARFTTVGPCGSPARARSAPGSATGA